MLDRRSVLKAGFFGLLGGSFASANDSRVFYVDAKLPPGMTQEQFMEELKYRFKHPDMKDLVIGKFDEKGKITNEDEFMGPWTYFSSPDDYLVAVGPDYQNRTVKFARRSGVCYVHMKDAFPTLDLSTESCEAVKVWGEIEMHQSLIGREVAGRQLSEYQRTLIHLATRRPDIPDDIWLAEGAMIAPTTFRLTPRSQKFGINMPI